MIISTLETEARKRQSDLLDATERYLKGEINGEEFDRIQKSMPRTLRKKRWFDINIKSLITHAK